MRAAMRQNRGSRVPCPEDIAFVTPRGTSVGEATRPLLSSSTLSASKPNNPSMEQITTLFDRNGALDQTVLPEELRIIYGGDLRFLAHDDRPYVIGNFVSTLDGGGQFRDSGKSGGDVGGFNEADRFIKTGSTGMPGARVRALKRTTLRVRISGRVSWAACWSISACS